MSENFKIGDYVRPHPVFKSDQILKITQFWKNGAGVLYIYTVDTRYPNDRECGWHHKSLIPLSSFESLVYETLDSQ